ncbi:MAG: carbohydrate ABC transporter permease [Anaerolineae bacterium]|nr:carbohydrate ABC transporter permease [Anaerolineae bacterium]
MDRNKARLWFIRLMVYLLLGGCGFIMLFPFAYMMFTSVKNSTDVFHYPPRLLPYSAVTAEYEGQTLPVYKFEIDGETYEMVLTDEKVRYGFFTTQENIDVNNTRQSKILVELPIDEAVETEEEVTLSDPSTGKEDSFPVFEVPVSGESQNLLLAYRSSLDVFVEPGNPEFRHYAVARTAKPVEEVEFQLDNYDTVLGLNLDRAFTNTILVTVGVTLGQLITSIFGGYAFARIPFPGRNTIFILYLGSIMIPFVVLIVPLYRLMVVLGWQDRLVSLIVPWIFTAYGTFLMRQFFLSIPHEIEEAALLDGASRFRILWTIFVPLSTPVVATQAIFTFLYAWNSFLWPLIIIGEGDERNPVLTLALIQLSNIAADKPNLVMTGAAIAILPPIIVFILAQKYFIESVSSSAVKG